MSNTNNESWETEYFPAADEYDPGISVEMWLAALTDEAATTPENLDMLFKMLELGGASTCANLAKVYGKKPSYYISQESQFARHIKKKFDCPDTYYNWKGEKKDVPLSQSHL